MLILSRRAGEAVVIETPSGERVKVVVLSKHGNQVRMGIIANTRVAVDREEIHLRKKAEPAAEKPEPTTPQHPEPFAYYRRHHGHEMLFASDLDAEFVPGDDWTPLYTQPQPAVPEGWRAILEEALAMMTSQPMTLERQADAVTGVRSLLSTPTTPQVDGWVSMADREPTKSDEDCEGKIWLLWPDRRYFERVPRGHVSCAPEFYWMPTGLKRPQPPKREAPGDE